MRSMKKTVGVLLALLALAAIAELKLETGVLVSPAEAVVGRPLTPISYAGVARRTTRRAVASGAYGAPAPGVYVW